MPDPVTTAPAPDVTTTKTVDSSPPTTSTTTSTTLKPGWKTTEFWLTLLSNVVSILLIADVFPVESKWAKLIGASGLVLSNLGYTVIRSNAKARGAQGGAASMLWPVLIGGSMFGLVVANTACTKEQRDAAFTSFTQCAKKEIKAQADELVPAFTNSIKSAIDDTGKVDRPTLHSVAAPLKSAAARCGFDAAVALLLNPPKAKDGAPASSPFPVDSVDLADAYNGVRSEWSASSP